MFLTLTFKSLSPHEFTVTKLEQHHDTACQRTSRHLGCHYSFPSANTGQAITPLDYRSRPTYQSSAHNMPCINTSLMYNIDYSDTFHTQLVKCTISLTRSLWNMRRRCEFYFAKISPLLLTAAFRLCEKRQSILRIHHSLRQRSDVAWYSTKSDRHNATPQEC